jgi:hypothetical protein
MGLTFHLSRQPPALLFAVVLRDFVFLGFVEAEPRRLRLSSELARNHPGSHVLT